MRLFFARRWRRGLGLGAATKQSVAVASAVKVLVIALPLVGAVPALTCSKLYPLQPDVKISAASALLSRRSARWQHGPSVN